MTPEKVTFLTNQSTSSVIIEPPIAGEANDLHTTTAHPCSPDGNVIERSRDLHRRFRRKFSGPNGVFTKFLIIIDLLLLGLFVFVQSIILDLLILRHHGFEEYIYLSINVIPLVLFYYSVVNAHRYYQRRCSSISAERKNCRSFSLLNLNFEFPDKMGELPFIYISWLVYTLFLIVRIVWIQNIIFLKANVNVIQVEAGYALTSIIFILFMEAHRNSEDDSHFQQTSSWTENLMQHTALEIFDSVILLDLIMPDPVTKFIDRENWDITLFLAVVNFFMPAVSLFHLSQLASSINSSCSSLNLIGMSRNIFLHIFRLVGVNIAYLYIRLVTNATGKVSSIFVIKNLLGILMGCRSLFKEIFEYLEQKKKLKVKRKQKEAVSEEMQNVASGQATSGVELGPIATMMNEQNFDDVSMKSNESHHDEGSSQAKHSKDDNQV